jgi:hypothetical protein
LEFIKHIESLEIEGEFVKKVLAAILIVTFSLGQSAHAAMESPRLWDGKNPVKVTISLKDDAMAGYNIRINTRNFRWAPQHASMKHVAGEGHAHLYVDGVKVARVYSAWFHLNTSPLNLKSGVHVVTVSLNGNDHRTYELDGKLLEATAPITIAVK